MLNRDFPVMQCFTLLLTTLLTGVFIFYISNWNQTNINLTICE